MRRIALQRICLLLMLYSAGFGLQLDPQALREKLSAPEFVHKLREILDAVRLGSVPSADPKVSVAGVFIGIRASQKFVLPAAGICSISEVVYRCEWETKPNKYSVAVLQDDIVASVAGALSENWKREKGETLGRRYTEFTDPTGEIAITVSCPVSMGDFALNTYTARLTIHSTRFGMR